jgi:hypothetical protein
MADGWRHTAPPTTPCIPISPPPPPTPPTFTPHPCAEGGAPRALLSKALRRLDALLDKSASDPLKLSPGLDTRLSSAQRATIHLNRCEAGYPWRPPAKHLLVPGAGPGPDAGPGPGPGPGTGPSPGLPMPPFPDACCRALLHLASGRARPPPPPSHPPPSLPWPRAAGPCCTWPPASPTRPGRWQQRWPRVRRARGGPRPPCWGCCRPPSWHGTAR